jgi:hypothetical protein
VKRPAFTSHPSLSTILYTAADDMENTIMSLPQRNEWVNIHLAVKMRRVV